MSEKDESILCVKQQKQKRPLEDNEDEMNTADSVTTKQSKGGVPLLSQKQQRQLLLPDIPLSQHYHVSWMHAATITAVVTSVKHGYVITADSAGIVKFWKRLKIQQPLAADDKNKKHASSTTSTGTATTSPSLHPCIEFVKSFTAHAGPISRGTVHGRYRW